MKFQQRDLDKWETLEAGCSLDYAWDEPQMGHRLKVELKVPQDVYKDTSAHEYNLDDIKVTDPLSI